MAAKKEGGKRTAMPSRRGEGVRLTRTPAGVMPPRMIQRICILLGGLAGATGVAMAAVAAHGLPGLSEPALAAVRSAVQIQMWHALALVGAGLWLPRGGVPTKIAALGFAAGTALFCFAVYGHEIVGLPVGFLAPFGGTALIAAWVVLAVSALRR